MSFLLDTNVVSEWTKSRPNAGVVRWLDQADEDRIFLSAGTLAELHYGIRRLADGARRKGLENWLRGQLLPRFAERILPIDDAVADAWGKLVAARERIGRPLDVIDAFIAATAEVHALTLVTRNVSDFEGTIKSLLNPWD